MNKEDVIDQIKSWCIDCINEYCCSEEQEKKERDILAKVIEFINNNCKD